MHPTKNQPSLLPKKQTILALLSAPKLQWETT